MPGAKEAQPMPDGILIIDKPTGWTSMDETERKRANKS